MEQVEVSKFHNRPWTIDKNDEKNKEIRRRKNVKPFVLLLVVQVGKVTISRRIWTSSIQEVNISKFLNIGMFLSDVINCLALKPLDNWAIATIGNSYPTDWVFGILCQTFKFSADVGAVNELYDKEC